MLEFFIFIVGLIICSNLYSMYRQLFSILMQKVRVLFKGIIPRSWQSRKSKFFAKYIAPYITPKCRRYLKCIAIALRTRSVLLFFSGFALIFSSFFLDHTTAFTLIGTFVYMFKRPIILAVRDVHDCYQKFEAAFPPNVSGMNPAQRLLRYYNYLKFYGLQLFSDFPDFSDPYTSTSKFREDLIDCVLGPGECDQEYMQRRLNHYVQRNCVRHSRSEVSEYLDEGYTLKLRVTSYLFGRAADTRGGLFPSPSEEELRNAFRFFIKKVQATDASSFKVSVEHACGIDLTNGKIVRYRGDGSQKIADFMEKLENVTKPKLDVPVKGFYDLNLEDFQKLDPEIHRAIIKDFKDFSSVDDFSKHEKAYAFWLDMVKEFDFKANSPVEHDPVFFDLYNDYLNILRTTPIDFFTADCLFYHFLTKFIESTFYPKYLLTIVAGSKEVLNEDGEDLMKDWTVETYLGFLRYLTYKEDGIPYFSFFEGDLYSNYRSQITRAYMEVPFFQPHIELYPTGGFGDNVAGDIIDKLS